MAGVEDDRDQLWVHVFDGGEQEGLCSTRATGLDEAMSRQARGRGEEGTGERDEP